MRSGMRARSSMKHGHEGGTPAGDRPVVLIIDDDAAFRDALSELIADEGLSTVVASNGRQALDMLASGLRPIAILLDMMMPVMDGPAFRAAQLASDEARSIPVAVMSASGRSSQEILTAFGDVEYIPKPTSGAAVVAFVNSCRLSCATGSATRAAR